MNQRGLQVGEEALCILSDAEHVMEAWIREREGAKSVDSIWGVSAKLL